VLKLCFGRFGVDMAKQRIIGIDVARALAVIGMIIVNFKVVFGDQGTGWIKSIASVFDGKAAATFVFLAGVGLALMTNSAIRNNDMDRLKTAQKRIAKRALFLFVVGISYIVIWPADILHFYGIYMVVVLLLLTLSQRMILVATGSFVLLFPVLMLLWNYEAGWDFNTLEYLDFWTVEGFMRNLFFNGFHPVIPWTAFMLFGYWFGKQDLHNDTFVKRAFWIGAVAFVSIQILSLLSVSLLSGGDAMTAQELSEILGTNPMPPLPAYMLNGMAVACTVVSACIILAKRFPDSTVVDAFNKTGQLALTFYVAHVIVGMGAIEVIRPNQMGSFSIVFSVLYALVFSFLCILFAIVWRKFWKSGPLEWIMRKVTN